MEYEFRYIRSDLTRVEGAKKDGWEVCKGDEAKTDGDLVLAKRHKQKEDVKEEDEVKKHATHAHKK